MKAKVQTILTFALLLALTVFPIVLAQDTVGVKAGDWVKYSITRLGSDFAWVENAVWIKVEVLNVADTTVTIRETIHYDDGSELVRNFSSNLPTHHRYIIATNLGPGDKMWETRVWFENWTGYVIVDVTLNDTDYRSYGGVTREANQLTYSSRLLKDAFAPYFINGTLEDYWDKRTGFLLEWKIQEWSIPIPEEGATGKGCSSTYKMQIADTNMWEMEKPPQHLPWWLVAVPVGVVIVAAVAVKVRNNRKNEDDKQ